MKERLSGIATAVFMAVVVAVSLYLSVRDWNGW
jgi:hypothetical protein